MDLLIARQVRRHLKQWEANYTPPPNPLRTLLAMVDIERTDPVRLLLGGFLIQRMALQGILTPDARQFGTIKQILFGKGKIPDWTYLFRTEGVHPHGEINGAKMVRRRP